MPAGDLCSTSDVKAFSQIAGSQGDTEIAYLVTAVSAWVKTYTNRDFVSKSYSEIRDGNGTAELFVRNGPVTAVSSLTIDGTTISAQSADQQPGYFIEDTGDVIALFGYRFCRGRKNVRVTYTAGSNTIPADLAQAVIEIVAAAYKRGPRGPEQKTQSEQGQVFSYDLADIPAVAKTILARWQRVVPL